jgi:CheY-like chemotaxis protein
MAEERVLIVDDNEQNVELAAFVLEHAGFSVTSVNDATRVVALVIDSQPDLVLMDVQLPGTDGLSLTRMLKQDARTKHIPVIAFTAYAMKGDEEKTRAAGCDGYIPKPIDIKTFPERIRAAIVAARPGKLA